MAQKLTPPSDTAEALRVGATIRTLREARGVRVGELARQLSISHGYLSNIEAGRKSLPAHLLAPLADSLAVRPIAIVRPDHFAGATS